MAILQKTVKISAKNIRVKNLVNEDRNIERFGFQGSDVEGELYLDTDFYDVSSNVFYKIILFLKEFNIGCSFFRKTKNDINKREALKKFSEIFKAIEDNKLILTFNIRISEVVSELTPTINNQLKGDISVRKSRRTSKERI